MDATLVLFDAPSTDEVRRRLQVLTARHGVRFGAPRPFGSQGSRPCLPATASGLSPATPRFRGPAAPAADPSPIAREAPEPQPEGVTAVVPVWMWSGSAADLRAGAGWVLNHFVYPLVAAGGPFCVAFPFGLEELVARPLDVEQRDRLDLEDIATLLEGGGPSALAAPDMAAAALAGLDPDQTAAACHGSGPARVLAAAGSGKTKTMVARIATLVARGTPPQRILVLAFNAEAALQLEERLAAAGVPTTRRIERDAGGVHCATFNAFGYRFQQHVLGGAPAVSADGAAQEQLLRRVLAERDGRAVWDPYDAALSDATGRLAGSLTSWRAELVIPAADDRAAIDHYDRLQTQQGVQTFDDQIVVTVCALLRDPSLRRLLQDVYHYVLVDEFQDVNPAQQALLDILCRPWRNLFVVGDDDQLIYGWRSAHVGSIVDFGADLPPAPHTAYYTLPTNYRCSQEVVARAEQLVVNNQRRAGKSMRARPSAPPGAVLFATAAGAHERCLEIAAFLAAERLRLSCSWSDLAVLARFRAQLEAVRGGLRRHSVPVGAPPAAAGLEPVWAARLDRHLQAALRDDSLSHLPAAVALERLGDTLAGAREDAAAGVLDAARLLACDHATLAGLAAAWRRLAGITPGAWPAPVPATPADAAAAAPITTQRRCTDGVTLATIHSTKGREYASVVIVDFAPALEPLRPDELEEERRVLYVALTRAKHAALFTLTADARPQHPFMCQLARPPQRSDSQALRRELRRLMPALEMRAAELPRALAALLLDGPTRACFGSLDTAQRDRHPVRAEPAGLPAAAEPGLGETAARVLQLRSRLLERRLFAPRPSALRLLGIPR